MAKDFRYHNMKVLMQGMEAFVKKDAEKFLLKGLYKVQDELKQDIDQMVESGQIPVFTGNLRNSIGIGVYRHTKLVRMTPIRTDTNAPHTQSAGADIAGVPMSGIVGSDLLKIALDAEGSNQSHDSVNIAVFAAVPYAWWVNEYGAAQKGHEWGDPTTASGGRGMRFFNKIVGWKLWNRIGRYFLRGNKSNIEDFYQAIQ